MRRRGACPLCKSTQHALCCKFCGAPDHYTAHACPAVKKRVTHGTMTTTIEVVVPPYHEWHHRHC